MRALLDVNVLIALLDSDHVHHAAASQWLANHVEHGWASCPLTQNGCVRIMSQARYPNALRVKQVVDRLSHACGSSHHEFWHGDISLLDPGVINHERLLHPKQITDIYLLALAAKYQGRLVTFDRSIAIAAASRLASEENLLVI